jgi:enamine deaminase RidA (YjgF/YER057c/UK114 family)
MLKFDMKCPFHTFTAGVVTAGVISLLFSYISSRNSKKIQRFGIEGIFSDAIRYNNTVYISGQVGEGTTIEEQTLNALKSVDSALESAGSHRSKVVEVTVWLQDIEKDYFGMNSVYKDWIDLSAPPCRACVQSKLYKDVYKVEIRVVAAVV